MTWRDAITFAARSVRRRLGRALLTVLAVSLASALLSSLIIAGDVARSRVLDQVSRGGPLAGIKVDAAEAISGALDTDNPRRGDPKSIDEALRKQIQELQGVRSVLPVIAQPVWVVPPTPAVISTAPSSLLTKPSVAQPKEYGNGIVGADLRRTSDLPITVLEGRLPDPESTTEIAVTPAYIEHFGIDAKERKYVVGTEVEFGSARSIAGIVGAVGPSNQTRQSPRGRWVRALVVGVVAQDVDARVQLLVPEKLVRSARAWSVGGDDPRIFGTPASPYAALFVVAESLDKVGPVRKAINDLGFSTSTSEQLIADVQRYVHVVEIVLTGIGLIGLMIAALGISNAMLAAVRERRREIGVMKAIGARDRDVRRMFLLEAGFLGALGGAVGTAFGYGIARGLAGVVNNYLANQGFEGVSVGFPVGVVLAGVVGAAVLAVIAGTIPAHRAARLPARQAMGDQ